MELSSKITYLRKQKALTQQKLADELTLSRQAVSGWETGRTKPEIDNLELISNYFSISIEWFLHEKYELDSLPRFTPQNKRTVKRYYLVKPSHLNKETQSIPNKPFILFSSIFNKSLWIKLGIFSMISFIASFFPVSLLLTVPLALYSIIFRHYVGFASLITMVLSVWTIILLYSSFNISLLSMIGTIILLSFLLVYFLFTDNEIEEINQLFTFRNVN